MIIDTHCHLDQLSPKQLGSQLNSAGLYLTVGTAPYDWQKILGLSSQYPNIYPALGLHPWFVDSNWLQDVQKLNSILESNTVKAIGEIGLDYSDKYIQTKALQLMALEHQLSIAEQRTLPLSLHVYKAHNDLLSLLKQFDLGGVIHGLGSSLEISQSYIDLGYKLGTNGILVRGNARRYHQLVTHFGIEHFVIETDAPNVSLPGNNEPHLADINTVVTKLSDLTGLSRLQVERITTQNAKQVFNL